MAKNVVPIFGRKGIFGGVAITAANAARDGSGTIVPLVAGVTDGRRIDRVTFISAQATAGVSAANVGRLFKSNDGGTSWKLFDETSIATVTASTTVVGARNQLTYGRGLILETANDVLGVTLAVRGSAADDHHVLYEGEDFTDA